MQNRIAILKKARCGNLSNPNKKTLTYNVAHSGNEFHLRISDNDGGGFFSDEWISLSTVAEQVTTDEPFSTSILSPLYESKSSNNQGFMAAVLVAEKLWFPVIGNKRLFTYGDTESFELAMGKLITKGVNLKDEVLAREAAAEAKRKVLEKKLQAQRKANARKSSKVKS